MRPKPQQELIATQQILISKEEIREKVKELSVRISESYAGRVPVLLCVLNGSFLFFADLTRELTIDCEVDFIKISSYGGEFKTSGSVRLLKKPDCHLEGRDVIIVEDIIDSGLSINFLRSWLSTYSPKSLACAALLIKQGTAMVDYSCEFPGFSIPNKFVVGYGLDFAQHYRNLPEIYVLEPGFVQP